MKKKILFMVINMNVGGTEKALLNMIAEFPKESYEITILMIEKYGGFLESIPNEIRVQYLFENQKIMDIIDNPPNKTALQLMKAGNFIRGFNILFTHFVSKVCRDRSIFFKYILKDFKGIEGKYDIAVAYAGPMEFISYFVANKIRANKRIQWVHFDVTKIGFNPKFAEKTYQKFDKVFVVSKEAKNKLINKIPSINKKTEVFYNIVSPKTVRLQSKNGSGFEENYNGLRILTVGRLANEKGQDIAIRVLARLIDNGYNVKWYCIGEGDARNDYEKLTEIYKLKDHFIFLGSKTNPYPYIAECDIYVQPSRYEGYCITLIEARCLSKPIVTTKVNGANEQIKSGETGFITEIDENSIYNSVEVLIKNQSLRNKFSQNLDNENLEQTKQMEKIFKLID
ncbi:glycosyltransferase [Metabacillus endolithicus]|uniref:Glycosyltransferase n=1 Tax=Metabacillus endolithicus TaxID=1535204 RepID=A0ABW5BV23_9BACI|nr:glycosyltransferase [Metabacillus endolithicus]UPG64502.1 glycosyltransferase [Metabacillus endolithicus]